METNNRILIVDDNPAIHTDFRKILESSDSGECNPADLFLGIDSSEDDLLGYFVASAYQGEEGVEIARESLGQGLPFAMAFVDMRMPPGWDGLQTIKELWKLDPQMQVVICTAYSDHSWRDLQNELGRTDNLLILKKPFDCTEVSQLAVALTEKWQLQRELELALKQALVASEAKSQFVATMSHELRTPLNGMLGMTQLLAATELTEKQKTYLEACRTSGESLLRVIGDILDFSKIEAGQMELELRPVNLHSLIQGVIQSVIAGSENENVRIVGEADSEVPHCVIADGGKLSQVLFNILGNAAKFTRAGDISVAAKNVSLTEKWVEVDFVVNDTGIGISDDRLASIFDPFQQADSSTTRKYGGTGLGLSICQKLIRLMGGEIKATSQQKVGSEFSFALKFETGKLSDLSEQQSIQSVPHNNNLQVANEDCDNRDGVRTGSEASQKQVRILLVEDNEINQLFAEGLFDGAGFAYRTCSDGQQALDCLSQVDDFDIIFMDCQMPVIDGFEATKKIKSWVAQGLIKDIPIVALTANACTRARDECLSIGMVDFLSKPFQLEDIVRVIGRYTDCGVNLQTCETQLVGSQMDVAPQQSGDDSLPINLDELLTLTSNNTEIVATLLRQFVQGLPDYFGAVPVPFNEANMEEIYQCAHKLKGAALILAALPISEAATQLEHAAKSQNFEQTQECYPELMGAIEQFLDWSVAGMESELEDLLLS